MFFRVFCFFGLLAVTVALPYGGGYSSQYVSKYDGYPKVGHGYNHGYGYYGHGYGHDHDNGYGYDHHHNYGHDHEYKDYYTYPKYEYDYKVEDHHTGDIKAQHESRHGDKVSGYYALHQPDGYKRLVHYHADDHTGFHADMKYDVHHYGPKHYYH